MLVFTRKENEKVLIGNEISITVIKISGKQVRLGIEAPARIMVLREEVALRDNPEQVGQGENASPKSMIHILEEEDPALADLIKKKK